MKSTIYKFEKMLKADIGAIMTIERNCYDIGWTQGIMLACIKSNYDCIVLRSDNCIVGYGVLMAGFEESHLLNMCIDLKQQGKGLGGKLLKYIENICIYHQSKKILLEVRVSNSIALSLYKSFGFEKIGLRKNYYNCIDGKEDAIVMSKKILVEKLYNQKRQL